MRALRGQAEESPETDDLFEMLRQILAPEPGAHVRVGGDGRAFPVLRHDDPLAFELEVGALDRDDADAQRDGQLANRGDLLPRAQSPAATRCLICSMIWRYIGRPSALEIIRSECIIDILYI